MIGNHVKDGTRFQADNDYPEILADPFRCAFKQVLRTRDQPVCNSPVVVRQWRGLKMGAEKPAVCVEAAG